MNASAETVLRITGRGAEEMAVLLYKMLKNMAAKGSKTKGHVRMANLIKSSKKLYIYKIDDKNLKQFCTETKSTVSPIPCSGTGKQGKEHEEYYRSIVLVCALSIPASAVPSNDTLTAVHNLLTFIFGFIYAIGLILLGFGIVQLGMSFSLAIPRRELTDS